MRSKLRGCMVALLLAAALSGCTSTWRPSGGGLRPSPGMRIDMASRLPQPGTRMVYRQTNLDPTPEQVQSYEVVIGLENRREGNLLAALGGPLTDYLAPSRRKPPTISANWPAASARPATTFFLEFDPPLPDCPSFLTGRQDVRHTGRLRYYDRLGRPTARGSAERTVTLEGYEALTVGGVDYPDCVRLKVETQCVVPLVAQVRMTEYRWLAPRGLEVQRIQHISGLVLWRLIESTTLYELESFELPTTRPSSPFIPCAWQRCAVYLQPTLPAPRITGLRAELITHDELR